MQSSPNRWSTPCHHWIIVILKRWLSQGSPRPVRRLLAAAIKNGKFALNLRRLTNARASLMPSADGAGRWPWINRGKIVAKAIVETAVRSADGSPDGGEFLAPQARNGRPIQAAQIAERQGDGVAGRRDGRGRIAMGAASRLMHDGIDDAESHHVVRGDLHARRG